MLNDRVFSVSFSHSHSIEGVWACGGEHRMAEV